MPTPIDLRGGRFGRLEVLERKAIPKNGRNRVYWKCLCECGGQVDVRTDSLTRGLVQSCGCLKRERDRINLTANHSHKMSGTRLYHTWTQMKQRCHNKNNNSYERYGGRGIKVCKEWRESFDPFHVWAIENGYSDNMTIERIDNNADYSPDNCRWATNKEQSRNRRSNIKIAHQGRKVTLMELSEISGIDYKVIHGRYERGDRGESLIRPSGDDRKNLKGSEQHLSKLIERKVIEIKALLKTGAKQKDLATKYNVSPSTINSIAKGRTWKHV